PKLPSLQVVATSKDGGNTFTAPITIAQVTDYPVRGTPFDVVDLFNRVPGMSARVDCYPHPAADPSSNRVYVVWCDFGGGHGVVKAAVSSDGVNWTALGTVAGVANSNAFFPPVRTRLTWCGRTRAMPRPAPRSMPTGARSTPVRRRP